jgi:hypothetical protein
MFLLTLWMRRDYDFGGGGLGGLPDLNVDQVVDQPANCIRFFRNFAKSGV